MQIVDFKDQRGLKLAEPDKDCTTEKNSPRKLPQTSVGYQAKDSPLALTSNSIIINTQLNKTNCQVQFWFSY